MIETGKIWEPLKTIGVERPGSFALVSFSGRSQEKILLLLQNMLNESLILKQAYNDHQKFWEDGQWNEVAKIIKAWNKGPGVFAFLHPLKVHGWKTQLKSLEKDWVREIEAARLWRQAFEAMSLELNQMKATVVQWLKADHSQEEELLRRVSEEALTLDLETLVLERIAKTLSDLLRVKQERLTVLRQALAQMETKRALIK